MGGNQENHGVRNEKMTMERKSGSKKGGQTDKQGKTGESNIENKVVLLFNSEMSCRAQNQSKIIDF